MVLNFETQNKLTLGKMVLFAYSSMSAVVLWLIYVNLIDQRFVAGYYASLHTIAALVLLADIVFDRINPKANFLDTYAWDTHTAFGRMTPQTRRNIILFSLALFAVAFLTIGSKPQLAILSPSFQIIDFGVATVELGEVSKHIVTFLAATAESNLFFMVLLATFRRIFTNVTRDQYLGLGISIILTATLFTVSHAYVFAGNPVDFFRTGLYAVFAASLVAATHTVLPEYALHAANNLGISIFKDYTLQSLFISLLQSRLLIILLLATGIITLLAILSRRRSK